MKLSDLSSFISEIAPPQKTDQPPMSLVVPYADRDGNFVMCPLDTLARKVESDLSKLRTFARNNGLSLADYSEKAQALVNAFADHIKSTAVPMIDHNRWETEIAARAERTKGATTVPTTPDND